MTNKIYLWEDEVPNQKKDKKEAIIELDKRDNITKIIKVTNPLIEVFEPEEKINNGKAILICPGGSYKILALDLEGIEPALWLTKLGYTAYVLQYRVPNNTEGAFNDIQRAFKLINKNFNHKKLGVLGFSAGGNLCARLSTNFSTYSYRLIDEADKEDCKPDFTLLIYPAYLDLGENNTVSLNLLKDKNLAPIFIFGTEDDPYYNNTIVFSDYLKIINCDFELQTLPNGNHGYGLRKGNKAAETWPILAEKWLNSITK
jgi:acetyl esterase/lipase|tara:strand:- start:9475 stop:10248 length:774 start_codon:yes stop_codon:yes gene_type:complete